MGDYSIDLSRYYANSGLQKHFFKFHLFFNYDFKNPTKCFTEPEKGWRYGMEYIHECHRVHIFFSRSNPSINDGSLAEFIKKCEYACDRRVLIHIPKRHPELKEEITKALEGMYNWEMIFEKNSNVTLFDFGTWVTVKDHKGYAYVAWYMDNQIVTGFCNKVDPIVRIDDDGGKKHEYLIV